MTECMAPILPSCNMELKLVVRVADQGMDYVCHKHFDGEDYISNDCCFLYITTGRLGLRNPGANFKIM